LTEVIKQVWIGENTTKKLLTEKDRGILLKEDKLDETIIIRKPNENANYLLLLCQHHLNYLTTVLFVCF